MEFRSAAELGTDPVRCDVAVVGGGAAGISLTMALEEAGADVVLLEAGGEGFDARVQRDYTGRVDQEEGLALAELTASRLRSLGGSTNHWGGWCRPLAPEVFSLRPWVADVGWPFPRAELDPFYAEAHELCELGPYQYDAAAIARDLKVPVLGLDDDLVAPAVWRFSPPTRFGEQYAPTLASGAARILLDAPVVDLEVFRGRIGRLVVAREDEPLRVEPERVVLATGGIEVNRQLLQLAATAPELDLDRSGWLGVGFMEHPHVAFGHVSVDDDTAAELGVHTGRLDLDGVQVRAGLTLRPDVLEREGMAGYSVTLDLRDEDAVLPHRRAVDELAAITGAGTGGRHLLRLYARTEQRPRRASRVELDRRRDRHGVPQPVLRWRLTPADREDLRRGSQLVGGFLAAAGVGPVYDRAADGRVTEILGGNHHLGGGRMHASPDLGVVDEHGRVHALDNCWVASSAVFPTGGFANPTLTIVALALRLARHLQQDGGGA